MKKLILILSFACFTIGLTADQFTLDQVQVIAQDIETLLKAQDKRVPTDFQNDIISVASTVMSDCNIDEDLLKGLITDQLPHYGQDVITQAIEHYKQNQKADQSRTDEEFARSLANQPANNNITEDDPELELAIAENLETPQRDPALERAILRSEQIKKATKLFEQCAREIKPVSTPQVIPSAPQDTTNPTTTTLTQLEQATCVICQEENILQSVSLSCGCNVGHGDCITQWLGTFENGTNTYEQDLTQSYYDNGQQELGTVPVTGSIGFKCPVCGKELQLIEEKNLLQARQTSMQETSIQLPKENECFICFESDTSDQDPIFQPCKHMVHLSCLNEFETFCKKKEYSFTCPLCKHALN